MRDVFTRLRASERLIEYVSALARHHLRLGFLVHEMPLDRRAIYRYLRACEPVQVEVTLLSVADRLATRGRGSEQAIARHLALAEQMLPDGARLAALAPAAARCAAISSRARSACGRGRSSGGCSSGWRRRATPGRSAGAMKRSPGPGRCLAGGAARQIDLRWATVNDPNCIFCKIVAGEIPGQIIAEDEHTIAFMDINPATRGHSLVIPRRHSRDLLEIGDDDLAATIVGAKRLAERVQERLGADGVSLLNSCGAAAWQTVFHFHIHVIPRYTDDPLRLPWNPTPGDMDEIAAVADELR